MWNSNARSILYYSNTSPSSKSLGVIHDDPFWKLQTNREYQRFLQISNTRRYSDVKTIWRARKECKIF